MLQELRRCSDDRTVHDGEMVEYWELGMCVRGNSVARRGTNPKPSRGEISPVNVQGIYAAVRLVSVAITTKE